MQIFQNDYHDKSNYEISLYKDITKIIIIIIDYILHTVHFIPVIYFFCNC